MKRSRGRFSFLFSLNATDYSINSTLYCLFNKLGYLSVTEYATNFLRVKTLSNEVIVQILLSDHYITSFISLQYILIYLPGLLNLFFIFSRIPTLPFRPNSNCEQTYCLDLKFCRIQGPDDRVLLVY